jgi:hypothetical protein
MKALAFVATAVAGGLVGAAPALAEIITLDCQAEHFSRTWITNPPEISDESGSRGSWRFVLDTDRETVRLERSAPFINFQVEDGTGYLNGPASDVTFGENEITFCLGGRGCGIQIAGPRGWYQVERSSIDRLESRFHIWVKTNQQAWRDDIQYFGQCTRAAERQF